MRCYDKVNRENFIEKYGKLGNYIYILYGNKNVDIQQYSFEKEKEILEKMKNQVLKAKEELNIDLKYTLGHTIGFSICEYAFFNKLINEPSNINGYLGSGLISLLLAINVVKLTSLLLDTNDLKRNLYFLNNEDYFKYFDKTKEKHLDFVKGKAKKKIFASEKKNPFNINFIDGISQKDLETINDNVLCENKLYCIRKEQ